MRAATEQISDPEARGVADRAHKTLKKSAEGAESNVLSTVSAAATIKSVLGHKCDATAELSLTYVASLAVMAANMKCFEPAQWASGVCFISLFSDAVNDIRFFVQAGVDLYKGNFSLAYETLTLLRDTEMHLKRNRFYGLLGPNQCGKTTLMRAGPLDEEKWVKPPVPLFAEASSSNAEGVAAADALAVAAVRASAAALQSSNAFDFSEFDAMEIS